jgi:hypothetical protein
MSHKDGHLLFMTIYIDDELVCFILIQKIDEILRYMDQFFENKQGFINCYVTWNELIKQAFMEMVNARDELKISSFIIAHLYIHNEVISYI